MALPTSCSLDWFQDHTGLPSEIDLCEAKEVPDVLGEAVLL